MMRIAGQSLAYALFAATVGLFSVWPEYRMLGAGQAMISLSFSHAAKRIGECRVLSQQDLNALPPNMRKPNSCPRERHATYVEIRSDDVVIYSAVLSPSGLWQDGKANAYYRAEVDAGQRTLFVGMNDSGGADGFDYTLSRQIELEPGQNLVIGFDGLSQSFFFR